jgi:hypothetical protein
MDDAELRSLLADLPPRVRDVVRRAAGTEQWERDQLAQRLERNPGGLDMAGVVDRLSLSSELRQQVVRVLGELEANGAAP